MVTKNICSGQRTIYDAAGGFALRANCLANILTDGLCVITFGQFTDGGVNRRVPPGLIMLRPVSKACAYFFTEFGCANRMRVVGVIGGLPEPGLPLGMGMRCVGAVLCIAVEIFTAGVLGGTEGAIELRVPDGSISVNTNLGDDLSCIGGEVISF